MGFIIKKITAFVAEDPDSHNDEGIIGFAHKGTLYPMISGDEARAKDYYPLAKAIIAKSPRHKLKVIEFTVRQEVTDEYERRFGHMVPGPFRPEFAPDSFDEESGIDPDTEGWVKE